MNKTEKEKPTELSIIAGKNLGILRKKFHISQEKFAELLEISSPHLSNIERGKCGASLKLIEKILHTFPVTPNELFLDNSKRKKINNLTNILRNNMESFGFNLYMELTEFYSSTENRQSEWNSDNYKIPPKKRNVKTKVADIKGNK